MYKWRHVLRITLFPLKFRKIKTARSVCVKAQAKRASIMRMRILGGTKKDRLILSVCLSV